MHILDKNIFYTCSFCNIVQEYLVVGDDVFQQKKKKKKKKMNKLKQEQIKTPRERKLFVWLTFSYF